MTVVGRTIGEITELHRRAALLAYFEIPWIIGQREFRDEEVENFLLNDCDRVSGPENRKYWSLNLDARRVVVSETPLDELLSAAAHVSQEAPTAPAELLRRHLADELGPLNSMTEGELTDLGRLTRWLDDQVDQLPTHREIQRVLDTRAHVAPLAGLLVDGFFGRIKLLEEIDAFFEDDNERPFVLHGPGGSGKSTLLAHISLDANKMPKRPLVYITFDRRQLSTADPRLVLDEFVRQLGLQRDAPVDVIDGLRDRIRTESKFAGDVASRSVEAEAVVSDDVLDEIRSLFDLDAILLLLDTFEEVQRKDSSHLNRLWRMLDDLRSVVPGLRTIIAGRAPVPDADGREWPLDILDLRAATAYLTHLLRDDARYDEEFIPKVIDLVGRSPLSLRLAAELLRKAGPDEDPYLLLDVIDGQVEGILYDRILRHIRDVEVRRIAHPGLILRRITPELIEKVLAKPCGLRVRTSADAEDLFWRLRREATLVARLPGEMVLVHRADVRELMLPMLRRSEPDLVRAIHTRAIRYYRDDVSIVGRVERMYHRLMLGQTERTLDKHWQSNDASVHRDLAGAYPELPLASKLFLARRLDDIDIDSETRAAASDVQWATAVAPRVQRRLSRAQLAEALDLLRERRSPGGHSLLPRLEVEALERRGEMTSAIELARQARVRAAEQGDRLLADDLTLDIARIHERMSEDDKAMEEVSRLLPDALSTRDEDDEDELLGSLVVLTTWLRIESVRFERTGEGRERRKEIEQATAARALALPSEVLAGKPSLYRDVVAEVGHLVPDLVVDAAATLGISVEEVEEQEELASVLTDWDEEVSAAEGSAERLIERKVATSDTQEGDKLLDWVTEADRSEVGNSVSDLLRDFGQGDDVKQYIQKSYRKESRKALDIIEDS